MLILTVSYFYKSYALYEEKKDFDAINGPVEDPGDIYFAYYIDGVISRNMPVQNTGYTLDETKSNCNNGVVPTWNNAGWKFIGDYHNYSATTNTRTKCTLYFNKTAKTVKTALGNIEVNTYTPDFTKSACDDDSCESHEKGIFETNDYDGNPTYYYRGSVENNYVKFAGFYWRIVRINSNGSIRMIYDGTVAHDNGKFSEEGAIGKNIYNPVTDNAYAGYMYTINSGHGLDNSSEMKKTIDSFFTNQLDSYINYLDVDVGFCGDRSVANGPNDSTYHDNVFYKAFYRVSTNMPTLVCENELDFYTTPNSKYGNKALTYPIALISADEAIYAGLAGGVFQGAYNYTKSSINNYLVGTPIYTMTPCGGYTAYGSMDNNWWDVHVFSIKNFLDDDFLNREYYTRPVINIRSDVTITGSGIQNDPYLVN